MRNYVLNFFKEYEYDDKDSAILLDAYDKTVNSEEAFKIFNEIMSIYESNISCNHYEELIKRADRCAELIDVHPYTEELLIYICMSKHLKTLYDKKGIDNEIFHNSMLDLKWKLEECKVVKGICGSFVAWWFPGFFDLTRFALGRLQFEVVKLGHHYEKNGYKLTPDSKVINVHIPRTGTPFDKESCDKAYQMAREFFKDEVGENGVFICHSWLLYPENAQILNPNSNTYRFMSEYDIIESDTTDGEDLWRLFDTDEKDPDKLPANTSMRRNYIEHMKKGGKLGWGLGVKTN